ncbi:unnamed protein product [Mesocestoides corti]|uniref:EGF-like domain-containing protein n=1 Tax=Mesocestoides corti TaxID=53468 RepID=A0A0R3UES4_MESCO|nr:unnamed protein product [Mesocestoides corti]
MFLYFTIFNLICISQVLPLRLGPSLMHYPRFDDELEHFSLQSGQKRSLMSNNLPISAEEASGALRRIIYEVLHCMRPCLNNGITILPRNTVDMCRCICQPFNYGLACEFEVTDDTKSHPKLM